ncbi:uncharacterized protein LOC132166245 [Corylus avellana]|uniref:uncharacterized protein LOC132166245 n=1 Tax=Corylus avellana TaxID=13451 RepID=UPI00286BD867|nr:uncharacterized protein LOC132166245 [Corylus avellana]
MTEPPPPPPLPTTESLIRRYKPVWRFFLIFNLALGAYIFAGARKKDASMVHNRAAEKSVGNRKAKAEVPSDPFTSASIPISEIPSLPSLVPEPVKIQQPIPEDQKLELFQWMLEEKRKIKPKDRQEQKQIDEEKTILKQFIRAKSVPSL